MKLTDFTPGQIITRTEPLLTRLDPVHNESLGLDVAQDPMTTFQFFGIPLTFLGIQNKCAYLLGPGYQNFVLNLHPDFRTDFLESWEIFEYPKEFPAPKMPGFTLEKIENDPIAEQQELKVDKIERDPVYLIFALIGLSIFILGIMDVIRLEGYNKLHFILTSVFSAYITIDNSEKWISRK